MSSQDSLKKIQAWVRLFAKKVSGYIIRFVSENRMGLIVITLVTLFFFAPLLPKLDTYSEGGDAMFNAWTLARNHNCILQNGCPSYVDSNIYFPNKDSMLYSETQLSAGLLTLPLHFINSNPIFSYNVWMILSVYFSAIFMYMLARYLSKGNEFVSIAAALIFEFAPTKMTAMGHLQNLSIFYLPLILLFCLKIAQYKTVRKRHILGLFIPLLLLFYASWYQMVFGLITIGVLVLGLLIFRVTPMRRLVLIAAITIIASLATLPLAKEYVRFSKSNQATFAVPEQVLFSSSLKDYLIPFNGTHEGKQYLKYRPNSKVNGYNPDSSSYHGAVLYLTTLLIVGACFLKYRNKRIVSKENKKLILTFTLIAAAGFIVSLGPLLKIGQDHSYGVPGYLERFVIPMPYAIVDVLLPQLSFIRAIGRATIIMLIALCCILALGGPLLKQIPRRARITILVIFASIAFFELAPNVPRYQYYLSTGTYAHNNQIPEVYKFIKKRPEIDGLVVLRTTQNYPGAPIPVARAEDVLWSGYHNKNIFNGYSGYEPKAYGSTYGDFVDFDIGDPKKMRDLGLKYVIVDKQLSDRSNLLEKVQETGLVATYQDNRYALFKL